MVEQRFSKVKLISIIFLLAVVIAITTAGVFLLKSKQLSSISKQTFLASVYNNKETYDDLFFNLQKPAAPVNAEAGIVSHHFLAKQLIAEFYNKIGSDKVSTIFLVSPDHYNNYFKPSTIAYTSNLIWDTPFGELQAEKNLIKSLLNLGDVEIKDSILGLEHGIYVEIPFIKKFFPNAKIVPLVLRSSASDSIFTALGERIKKISLRDSMLLVSSDFSHNTSAQVAKINDEESIDALKNLNFEAKSQITNDCRQCIAAMSGFLKDGGSNFYLIDNKNSFALSGEDENSVTSYVFGYYAKTDNIKILFAGDLMFDRGIRYYAAKNGGNDFIFDKILPVLLENDLVVANLEGPITDNKSISSGTIPGSANNYTFTFDPGVAKTLFDKNIRLVSLGNNHISNFGFKGEQSTKKYLEKEGVGYFGAPGGNRSAIENIGGIKIGFVSYNQFAGDNPDDVANEIKKVKLQTDLVFVFSHWGNEYELTESDYQKSLAHQFVDAGADLIIGSHPHVIQPSEEYKEKKIYYSLGNFIFDQYFEENVRNGLGVVVKINKATKQLEFEEKKFYLGPNGQTILK